MGELIRRLTENAQSDMYPFHMPGHKRVSVDDFLPYGMDITEVEGFDDLNHPEEVLKELTNRWANIYGADAAFLLVNGSTSGVLAAISATTAIDGHILMARNSHKSAYNAAYIRKLKVGYLYPMLYGQAGISLAVEPENVDKYLAENSDCHTVFITSPTYEGIISDVAGIAEVCHRHGAVLIVDAAHGAHLGMSEEWPKNAVQCGADIVIMSLHKTLPALTQSAIICVNKANCDAVKRFVSIYNTSSPSYLLTAGMERCADILCERGKDLHSEYAKRVKAFREKCKELGCLYLLEPDGEYDYGKIVICTDRCDCTGNELARILREKYHIETEMASKKYVVAMTSCMDTDEGFDRLFTALKEIDSQVLFEDSFGIMVMREAESRMRICEAYDMPAVDISIEEAEGRIAADYVYVYPPGIPWLAPGEVVTAGIIEEVSAYKRYGWDVRGMDDCGRIKVVE